MTGIFAIVGAILGALWQEFFGLVAGGLLGYLLGVTLAMRTQITALQQDVKLLIAARSKQQFVDQPETPVNAAEARTIQTSPPLAPSSSTQTETAANDVKPAAEHAVEIAPAMAGTALHTQTIQPVPLQRTAIEPIPDPAIISWLKNYFSGENLLARAGVVILFFGVAFLLKYAAERTYIPIELRLAGIAIGASVLLGVGWHLRSRHQDYALVLQGGSIGVLYLTVFAAMRLYQVLPPALTLLILVAVVAFSAMLAVLQNSRALAILGICGGFLAPILTSTGQGSHVVLFSYYTLLNAGIFGMAWFKAWRPLNVLGFLFTFVIATIWGVTKYYSSQFASTEPFLILFFLFYVAIAVLYALHQSVELKSYVDGTLVFGTPIIAFGLQAGMTQQQEMLQVFEYGLSFSAVALSLFYLTLARFLYARKQESLRLLVESFIALGIVFATLAIPLALDGRWTSAAWALEGAAVLWMGIRQQRWLARTFGALLQFAAGIALLDSHHYHVTPYAILNSVYLGGALLSVAGLFSAWYLYQHRASLKRFERIIMHGLFAWGVLWWAGSGMREIGHFAPSPHEFSVLLMFFALSALLFSLLARRLDWPAARIPALGLLPVMWLLYLMQGMHTTHPFVHAAGAAWLLGFAGLYLILYRHRVEALRIDLRFFHMAALWLLALVASREAAWQINDMVQGHGTWPLIAWAWMPGILLAIVVFAGEKIRWPLAAYLPTYLGPAAFPLVVLLWAWTLIANFNSDGNPFPLHYIPLLNPLDLANIFVFIILMYWLIKIRDKEIPLLQTLPPNTFYISLAAAIFIWLNAVLLRTLHYWAEIPYDQHSMMHSVLVQASLSIFWSILALALMKFSAIKQQRSYWMPGGALMAAVVIKLFTVDIASVGSLERIVSFIGVAVLMLIIGYIAPLPAKKQEGEQHA